MSFHGFAKDHDYYSNILRFVLGAVFWCASVKHSKCKTKGNVSRNDASVIDTRAGDKEKI